MPLGRKKVKLRREIPEALKLLTVFDFVKAILCKSVYLFYFYILHC